MLLMGNSIESSTATIFQVEHWNIACPYIICEIQKTASDLWIKSFLYLFFVSYVNLVVKSM